MNVAVVLDEDVDRALVEDSMPAAGQVNVTGLIEDPSEVGDALGDSSVDVLVVACKGASEGALTAVANATASRADCPMVALCESPPDYFVQALFDAGVDDVLKLPETAERVFFALEKAAARHRGRSGESRAGLAPMICVIGPKGGSGKTVTASNLVLGLAENRASAVIVDLDLQFGDVALAMGLEPRKTVYDLATSGGALDAEKLAAYITTHESGAHALLAPTRPDEASTVSTDLMRNVLSLLRMTYDYVVVDTPPEFTEHVIAAIDASSHTCMVGMLDALSIKNTKLGLETLELMGYDQEAVALVLNRADSHVGLTREDVESIIGRSPDVFVPSDREVPRSINEGRPIVIGKRRSAVAAAFRDLVGIYSHNGAAPAVRPAASPTGRAGRRRWLPGKASG